mmetsp:Transcript_93434/g.269064  ORF Transcript_93434/g.269064 Transcript_93434/m.269064 type:complete len:200 (-) Transcript_93434:30-629(-)
MPASKAGALNSSSTRNLVHEPKIAHKPSKGTASTWSSMGATRSRSRQACWAAGNAAAAVGPLQRVSEARAARRCARSWGPQARARIGANTEIRCKKAGHDGALEVAPSFIAALHKSDRSCGRQNSSDGEACAPVVSTPRVLSAAAISEANNLAKMPSSKTPPSSIYAPRASAFKARLQSLGLNASPCWQVWRKAAAAAA